MGLLDSFLKRNKPKVQKDEQLKTGLLELEEIVPKEPQKTYPGKVFQIQGNLDLSKKISLNFSKLNLDKKDVRDKTLFLLDVSGSMSDRIGKKRKIDSLREVMSKYDDAKMVSFSNRAMYHNGKIPEPNGGTNLAGAFIFIKDNKLSPERIVLVSDGEPDSTSDAKYEAKSLSIPIDIIFIGDKGSDGEEFMEELAELTGGEHFVV